MRRTGQISIVVGLLLTLTVTTDAGDTRRELRNAFIDGQGEGWRDMVVDDFTNVNCNEDTWTWRYHELHCTGKPIGVIRSQEQLENFELVLEWKHLQSGGNSGIFAWTPAEAIQELEQGNGRLPSGIEFQVLDEGYGKADWFTCHGDVFPCGTSSMKPFPPVAPNGKRSFPSKNLTKPFGHWNHYYIRAINGEVRLWVNGEEVSGGTKCQPASGYLCLESEGAPIVYRNIRIRNLP